VLGPVLAEVFKGKRYLVLDLVIDIARQANAAGLRQGLHACGHVDAVTEEVITFDHHIADVQPDAEAELLLRWESFIASRNFLLDLDSGFDRLDGPRNLGNDAIVGAA